MPSWPSRPKSTAEAAGVLAAPLAGLLAGALLVACAGDHSGAPSTRSIAMRELGHGDVETRFTAELDVRGHYAYTTTWRQRSNLPGDAVFVWDVTGDAPRLADSAILDGAVTTGDVQVSDDGALLAVATEYGGGSMALFSLADPAHPAPLSRFHSTDTDPGVHTATLARVNGTLYAFLCIDPTSTVSARLVVLSLADPAHPTQLAALPMGNPFVHDVFVREGLLFTALWDDGIAIWDIGGGGRGGAPGTPVRLSRTPTVGGHAHNIWWYHDPAANPSSDSARYAFVGEEEPGALGSSSGGDIHVLDVHDLGAPREVAFFHVDGAGTHNFSVDEPHGILYAAYYNGGVRVIDVRGALGACDASHRAADGRCDLAGEGRELAHGLLDKSPTYVWGVKYLPPYVFASDMLDGLWKLDAIARP
jgi:hypothetical protein